MFDRVSRIDDDFYISPAHFFKNGQEHVYAACGNEWAPL